MREIEKEQSFENRRIHDRIEKFFNFPIAKSVELSWQ
jgi:hypothetical protein